MRGSPICGRASRRRMYATAEDPYATVISAMTPKRRAARRRQRRPCGSLHEAVSAFTGECNDVTSLILARFAA